MLDLNKQLKTSVVDGELYVHLDGLLQVLYDSSTYSAKMAQDLNDPALATMVLGMTTMCDVIEKLNIELKNRAGL
jgi:hypothetical protein